MPMVSHQNNQIITHRSPLTKLTQGKNRHIHFNFLEDNFEYFRLSTVRKDEDNQNQALFLILARNAAKFGLKSSKISLKSQKPYKSNNYTH